MAGRIYLDSMNGGPLRREVAAAMAEALSEMGTPASQHAEGRRAGQLLDKARSHIAALIGVSSEEIYFTSSGTEANTWALHGLTKPHASKVRHLVVSAVEHLSILQTVRRMERDGWTVTVVPVDGNGWVDPMEVEKAIRAETVLVSVQWANGEVGTIQPMAEIARRVKGRGVLLHSDAVAAAAALSVDVRSVPVDALSVAANTMGGPPGVGALFIRKGVRIDPLFVGGTQEAGWRSGTENLIGIVGMGQAAAVTQREFSVESGRLTSLRDHLIQGILDKIPEARLNGHPAQRLPGHVSVGFPGMDAETLVCALDLEGVAAGIGSACSTQTMKTSHVLKAMGVEESRALGTITLTLGPETTEEGMNRVPEILARLVFSQRSSQKKRGEDQSPVRPELVEG